MQSSTSPIVSRTKPTSVETIGTVQAAASLTTSGPAFTRRGHEEDVARVHVVGHFFVGDVVDRPYLEVDVVGAVGDAFGSREVLDVPTPVVRKQRDPRVGVPPDSIASLLARDRSEQFRVDAERDLDVFGVEFGGHCRTQDDRRVGEPSAVPADPTEPSHVAHQVRSPEAQHDGTGRLSEEERRDEAVVAVDEIVLVRQDMRENARVKTR